MNRTLFEGRGVGYMSKILYQGENYGFIKQYYIDTKMDESIDF